MIENAHKFNKNQTDLVVAKKEDGWRLLGELFVLQSLYINIITI